MITQEILNQNTTKTRKIEQLILAGLTRTEIARLVTNGNYGFVQNVYAKMKSEGRLNATAIANFAPLNSLENLRFGVEIECFGIDKNVMADTLQDIGIACHVEGRNHQTRRHWKIVTDGSITGTGACEVVSPILEGDAGLEELKKVCEVLGILRAKINRTCGLHIHIDAQDFDLRQWKNIYLNYAHFEAEIDQLMPQSRRANNNSYCKSLNSISNLSSRIASARTLSSIETIFNHSRYFKVNPQSYSRHNTVEFRQHSGTIEFEKIANWVMFLHNFVAYSKNHLATSRNFESLMATQAEAQQIFYHNRKQDLAA